MLYGVILPKVLPLDSQENSSLHNAYSAIPKYALSNAVSPAKARVNTLYREFALRQDSDKYKRIMARTRGNLNAEVFSIPSEDFNQSSETRESFQEMELALEIAEQRGTAPEECYSDARTLIALTKKSS